MSRLNSLGFLLKKIYPCKGGRQKKTCTFGWWGPLGGGGRGPPPTFGQKGTSFFYAFIRLRTFQNVKIHTQKNLFGCTTPQKTCTFDHNWGRGGGVAILWWAPPKSTSFFFDVAPYCVRNLVRE